MPLSVSLVVFLIIGFNFLFIFLLKPFVAFPIESIPDFIFCVVLKNLLPTTLVAELICWKLLVMPLLAMPILLELLAAFLRLAIKSLTLAANVTVNFSPAIYYSSITLIPDFLNSSVFSILVELV